MLRSVRLPDGVRGGLWLGAMPGREAPVEQVWEALRHEAIRVIVCLAEPDEIRARSASYADALEARAVPSRVESFPIPDFGVPGDRAAFWTLAASVGERLKEGERVLIHCGAGVGRTGMLAVCVLLALGEPLARAEAAVSAAGSRPETAAQRAVVSWCAGRRGWRAAEAP